MNALSIARTGLAAATQRLDRAAGRMANAAAEPSGDAANLAEDIVGEIQAGYDFDANLGVIRTADAMLGSLLDVVA